MNARDPGERPVVTARKGSESTRIIESPCLFAIGDWGNELGGRRMRFHESSLHLVRALHDHYFMTTTSCPLPSHCGGRAARRGLAAEGTARFVSTMPWLVAVGP